MDAMDDLALLYRKVRDRMSTLSADSNALSVSWPVDAFMKPLGFLPQQLLTLSRLGDITWHDVPTSVWSALGQEEQELLSKDIWHFAKTELCADIAKAATKLAEEIRDLHDKQVEDVGLAFVFTLDPDSTDDEQEERRWLNQTIQHNLHDFVSANRREFQRDMKEKIEAFTQTHSGTIPITPYEASL